MPKKLKGGTLWDFSISILPQSIKKLKGGPWGFFFENSHNAKKMKGGPFSLSRYSMLRKKEEKPFWFSSLGQMSQFGTIKLSRTFMNYFGQFVWIEKKRKKRHYNSRVSLHEASTKNNEPRSVREANN